MVDNYSDVDLMKRLEELFGTDEACGVTFEVDAPSVTFEAKQPAAHHGKIYTAAEWDTLPEPRHGAESRLPNGGSAVCCTHYAALIFQRLPGRVEIFGFSNEDNPNARIVRERLDPNGHDFAVVDGRYLIDPWVRLVANVSWASKRIVFDLELDANLVEDLYGPKRLWDRMQEAEKFTASMYQIEPIQL